MHVIGVWAYFYLYSLGYSVYICTQNFGSGINGGGDGRTGTRSVLLPAASFPSRDYSRIRPFALGRAPFALCPKWGTDTTHFNPTVPKITPAIWVTVRFRPRASARPPLARSVLPFRIVVPVRGGCH